jgi:tetratricopeptide (TPR) repeat protein
MLGQFDRKFYIDFLRDIDEAGSSGILRLRQSRSLKALFFESGHLVFGISNLADEELGQHLVNLGRISAAQMKQIQAQMSRAQPLTQLLMQQNLISHSELAQAEQEVVAGIAISCFHWDDGEYTFDPSKTADHEFKTELNSLDILIEGIRRLRDEEYLHKALGDHSQIVRPVSDVYARTKRVNLNRIEGFILSHIERPKTVANLIAESGRPEVEVLRSLYALLATGVLDPLEENVQTPTPIRAQPVAPPTASLPRASGAFTKLSPLDQTYSTLHSTQKQAPSRPVAELRRSINKIDTGKLEALAGVKIRSSTSSPHDTEETSRAEQWFVQGKQLLRVGDLRRAEACFRQASEIAPEKAKFLLGLALLLIKRPASRKEAEGLLIRCCELEPQAIEPRIQLAGIYEQQGIAAKAEQLYKSVLKIDPEHPVALEKLKKDEGSIGTLFSKLLKK